MGFTCHGCRKPFAGAPTKSATGRNLCHDCSDFLWIRRWRRRDHASS